MEATTHAEEIPVRLTLGDTTLTLAPTGEWQTEHSALQACKMQVESMTARIAQLEAENQALNERCRRLGEEANMDKFKCQLLVEMLALSSLDEERSRKDAEIERNKTDSLKTDLEHLLEHAQQSRMGLPEWLSAAQALLP